MFLRHRAPECECVHMGVYAHLKTSMQLILTMRTHSGHPAQCSSQTTFWVFFQPLFLEVTYYLFKMLALVINVDFI